MSRNASGAAAIADLPSLSTIDAELARRHFPDFVEQAWHIVEPEASLVWNWHLDVICEHLEAVIDGRIRQLLMTVPPGHMKSLLVSVFFPCWVWLRRPGWRAIFASYAAELAIRDSVKCRTIIESEWYQKTFRPEWKLSGDQNVKSYFSNTSTGFRLAIGVGGKTTGFRGDVIFVDDPLNAKEQLSDAKLKHVLFWWDHAYANRVNSPERSARVIIMQRLHEQDLAGHVLETQPGKWDHVMLPTRFEPARAKPTSLGVVDKRTVPNELLFPQRFPANIIAEEESRLGPLGFAGQHQQSPTGAAGGMFREENWRIIEGIPANVIAWVRFWDVAATEGAGDYTAGVKMGKLADGRFIITDVRRGQWDSATVDNMIFNTAVEDGRHVAVREEQEGGASGKAVIAARRKRMAGFDYDGMLATGDKEVRAKPHASQQQGGNVLLYKDPSTGSPWIRAFIEEYKVFPRGKNDDQVDAGSGAFNHLTVMQHGRSRKLSGF
jgi:predicted phage terminase large subunit-like protein